jgi:chromosome segregation ATPase
MWGLFGSSNTYYADKKRSAFERLIDTLEVELEDIEREIKRWEDAEYDNEYFAKCLHDDIRRVERDYQELHWGWQTEKDHREKERLRNLAGNAMSVLAKKKQEMEKYERQDRKIKKEIEHWKRVKREKEKEIENTKREFAKAMDEIRIEIKDVESKIREIQRRLNYAKHECNKCKEEAKWGKEEAKRFETLYRNAKYQKKPQETIDEHLAEMEEHLDYAKQNAREAESWQEDIWKDEKELRELEDELRELNDAYR